MSTLTPALKIVLLLYLSIPRDKPRRFSLLEKEYMYRGTSVRTAILNRADSSGRFYLMSMIQVCVTVWWGY